MSAAGNSLITISLDLLFSLLRAEERATLGLSLRRSPNAFCFQINADNRKQSRRSSYSPPLLEQLNVNLLQCAIKPGQFMSSDARALHNVKRNKREALTRVARFQKKSNERNKTALVFGFCGKNINVCRLSVIFCAVRFVQQFSRLNFQS